MDQATPGFVSRQPGLFRSIVRRAVTQVSNQYVSWPYFTPLVAWGTPSGPTSHGLFSVQTCPLSLAVLLMPTISPVATLTIGEPEVPWMVPQPLAYRIESCHVHRSSRRVGTNVWTSQLNTRAKNPDGTKVSPAAGWL